MNDKKEIWKTYPEFDFIQGSNRGMVRTLDRVVSVKGNGERLVKGRILKPQRNRNGYLQVMFSVNGKNVHRSVHRIVAGCFLPNLNNWSEVNHKDNDPLNNSVSNLEWCTHEYNIEYREKYGVALNHLVFAINLNTLEVLRFKSQGEASRELGVANQSINAVLKGKQKTASGFWFTEDGNRATKITKSELRETTTGKTSKCSIITINMETQEILQFKSQHEASRALGINVVNINNVLKNRCRQSHGFWFTYADEGAVENTEGKFGNEVANKVAELMNEN